MIRSGGERLGRKSRVTSWHRLHDAANVFPQIAHQTFSNVFRVATELYEPIDAEILQHALDVTLPNFGNFNVISQTAHGQPVPGYLLLSNTLYAVLYLAIILSASILVFERREFK